MPDRRMIHRKITVSTDLAELIEAEGAYAGLFWTWLIPFYDRYGCVVDDPRALRALVCPSLDEVSAKDVKRWVDWCVKRKMLVRITGPDGDRGLRNPHFEDHQRGAHLERESQSPYEPPSVTKMLARPSRKGANSGKVRTTPDLVRSGPEKGRERKEPLTGGSLSPPSPPPGKRASPAPAPGAPAPPRSDLTDPEPVTQDRITRALPAHARAKRGAA